MAITIRSMLEVGKVTSPLIGGAIRLLGGKSKKAERTATVVENSLNKHPKSMTGGLTFAAVIVAKVLFPEQADAVIVWLTTNLPQILEGLMAAG